MTDQQRTLPGLEDYVCTFQCLTHCPFPDNPNNCPYADPDIGEPLQYPEFFFWRVNNLPNVELTPDSVDEFYNEPEDKNTYRCPRCLSTNVRFGEVWIICKNCRYNEPLVDFPENVGRLEKNNATAII